MYELTHVKKENIHYMTQIKNNNNGKTKSEYLQWRARGNKSEGSEFHNLGAWTVKDLTGRKGRKQEGKEHYCELSKTNLSNRFEYDVGMILCVFDGHFFIK